MIDSHPPPPDPAKPPAENEPADEPMAWWRWLLVALAFHAILLVLFFSDQFPHRSVLVCYVIGIVAGQTTCLAAWAACGPGAIFTRLPAAIFLAIGIWFVFVLGIDAERRDEQTPILTAILTIGHLVLVGGGLVLWRVASRGGFEFVAAASIPGGVPPPKPAAASDSRFSLLHIMGWTTAVAILCVIGMQVFRDRLDDFFTHIRELLTIVIIMGGCALVGAIQVVGISLQQRNPTYTMIAVVSIAAITLFEFAILASIELTQVGSADWLWEMGLVLAGIHAIESIVVWMTFGILYLGGLRWVDGESERVPTCP